MSACACGTWFQPWPNNIPGTLPMRVEVCSDPECARAAALKAAGFYTVDRTSYVEALVKAATA